MATSYQTGNCHVKCESYASSMVPRIYENLMRGAYCDCVLSSEGKYLRAHKLILSLSSDYFEVSGKVLSLMNFQ